MSHTQDDSYADKGGHILLRVVFGLAGINIFSKIFGFAEKIVIAHYFGTTGLADIYFASMGFLLSVVYLVKELIHPSLLPVFSASLGKADNISGVLFRRIFFYFAALLGVLAAFMAARPELVTAVFVPGFSDEKKILTADFLRMLSPAVLLWGLSMVTVTALNGRKLFIRAAWPEAIMKFFIAVGLLMLVPVAGVYAAAIVVNIAVVGMLVVHLYFLPESRSLLKTDFRRKIDEAKHVFALMAPVAVGVISSYISSFIDNMLGSTLPDGGLAYLGYAKKLTDAILLAGPVALVTVVYAQLCHLADPGREKLFAQVFEKSLRLVICFACPVSLLLIMLRADIISMLFERGQFCSESTAATAETFMFYAFGLMTFAIESLVVCGFFALKDTRTPVLVGLVAVVADIALAWGFLPSMQHLAIAMALVVSKSAKVAVLLWLMKRKLKGLAGEETLKFCIKTAAATALAGIAGSAVVNWVVFDYKALKILAVSAVFMSTFLASCQLLKVSELKEAAFIMLKKKYKQANCSQEKDECND